MNKNILIIGNTVIDKIHSGRNLQIKPGGIAYTLAGLINLQNQLNIYPVTELNPKYEKYYQPIFSNVKNEFINYSDEMPVVNLYLEEGKERVEKFESLGVTFDLENVIASSIEFEGALVNMINGFDVEPGELKKLKEAKNLKIYIDIHTLSRGVDENNIRYFREIPNLQEWLSIPDIIQVNELELDTISKGENEFQKANFVLNFGAQMLIVTKGRIGAALYYKNGDELNRYFVSAVKTGGKNSVGCGDIFGAAFFYSYICGENIRKALRFANSAAGAITNYLNFDDYENLKDDIERYIA